MSRGTRIGATWAPGAGGSYLFNPRSMRTLLGKAGYGVAETKRSVNQFPVTFLIKHAVFALGLGKINLPKLLWLRVPLRLGNFITIARPS